VAWLAALAVSVACGSDDDVPRIAVQRMGQAHDPAPLASEADPQVAEPAAEAAPVNRPPRFTGVQIDPAGGLVAGGEVRVVAHAVDPEGEEVRYEYEWRVNGEAVEASGPVFSTGGLRRGDSVQVRVWASDGRARSEIAGPSQTVANAGPVIHSMPAPAGADDRFRYQVRAEDPDGDGHLRFELAQAPPGMTVTRLGGLVEWSPPRGQSGTYPVEIVVEDSEGARTFQRFELTVGNPGPAAPAP
jgi:hypothetical protein